MKRLGLGSITLACATILVAPLVPGPASAGPTAGSATRSTPQQSRAATDDTRVERLPVSAATERRGSDDPVADLARTRTDPFEMVGVTWKSDPGLRDVHVRVRTRSVDGWSPWQELHADADGPAKAEGEPVAGTTPLWVGNADGVEVRVETRNGRTPKNLQVVLVDPADVPSAGRAAGLPSAGGPIGKPPKFAKRPPIISRKRWGADPNLGDKCFEPIYGKTTRAAFVHHTVGTNSYSKADSAGIVRGIHAYHTQGRGWCDVGYNLLVDKFGRVFEGRDGGTAKPVRGAHAGDYNTNTLGISMMGNFDNVRLKRRMKNALVRTIGWRLGTNYVNPRGKLTMHGTRLHRISGHRDVMSTACPGAHGYSWLPRLRQRVGRYLSNFRSPIRAKRRSLGRKTTGAVFVGERRMKGGRRTTFGRSVIFSKKKLGAHYIPRGPLLRGYFKRGGAGGRLGFPRRDYRQTKRKGVYVLATQRGRVYLRRGGNVHALTGPIKRAYVKRGGVTGKLGVPRSDSKSTKRGAKAKFARGRMSYDKQSKRIKVTLW